MEPLPLLTEATFERLLNRGHYGIIDGQLLFFSQELGRFVLTQISAEHEYTSTDYALLPEGAPYQLINGKLSFMAAPNINHQDISMSILRMIDNYVYSHKLGKVYHAPTDVKLGEKTIIQPDLLFVSIARKDLIKEKNIEGAPDFVVEILSPTNTKAEMDAKMALYGAHDVLEYWIVKPKEESVEVYHNQQQQMHLHQQAGPEDTITSVAIPGFELEVKRIFE